MPVALIILLLVGAALILNQSSQVTFMPEGQQSPADMQTSSQGKSDLIRHEGIRYVPYQDSAGFWTVGIGHLIVPGDGLNRTDAISEEQVMALFAQDLTTAEIAVRNNVRVPLTQGQFDALVDWTYQYGASRLAQSTLLKLINAYQYEQAAQEFPKWIYAGKPAQIVSGLVQRRADNYNTFLA